MKNADKRFVEDPGGLKRDSLGQPSGLIGIRRDSTGRRLTKRKLATAKPATEPERRAHRQAERGHEASVDRAALLERLDGDRALFEEVIAIFLDDCPRRLAAIKNAVDRSDATLIQETAHVLKGAAGNLAATRLFEAAQTLERIGARGRLRGAESAWRRLAIEAALVMGRLRQFAREDVDG